MKRIKDALNEASDEFRHAAEDEIKGQGSAYNVYFLMKESMALASKARNISRRFGIDDCNCD